MITNTLMVSMHLYAWVHIYPSPIQSHIICRSHTFTPCSSVFMVLAAFSLTFLLFTYTAAIRKGINRKFTTVSFQLATMATPRDTKTLDAEVATSPNWLPPICSTKEVLLLNNPTSDLLHNSKRSVKPCRHAKRFKFSSCVLLKFWQKNLFLDKDVRECV